MDSLKQPVAKKDNSKGNLVLWQAPHQVAHPLPTLRYAFSFPSTAQHLSKNLPRPSLLFQIVYNRNDDGNQLTHAFISGRRSLHIQKHTCSSCGYPAAKIRQCTNNLLPRSFILLPFLPIPPSTQGANPESPKPDNWGMKAKRRKTTGTGRMRSLKEVPRKFKNGFQTGVPKGSRGPANAENALKA